MHALPLRRCRSVKAEPPMGLLRPYAAAAMEAYPVSRAVNRPAQDEPSLIEPLTGV